jgi:hypothetical protein
MHSTSAGLHAQTNKQWALITLPQNANAAQATSQSFNERHTGSNQ